MLITAIIADPAAFGLHDALDPCLRFGVVQNVVCPNPGKYLFWDGLHPTAAGHRILAHAVAVSAFADRDG